MDRAQVRDFTYVKDIVLGTIQAAEADVSGEIFNLEGGRPRRVSDAISILESIFGRKCRVEHREAQRGDVGKTSADISRARARFGFKTSVLLEDGLKAHVEWARQMRRQGTRPS